MLPLNLPGQAHFIITLTAGIYFSNSASTCREQGGTFYNKQIQASKMLEKQHVPSQFKQLIAMLGQCGQEGSGGCYRLSMEHDDTLRGRRRRREFSS